MNEGMGKEENKRVKVVSEIIGVEGLKIMRVENEVILNMDKVEEMNIKGMEGNIKRIVEIVEIEDRNNLGRNIELIEKEEKEKRWMNKKRDLSMNIGKIIMVKMSERKRIVELIEVKKILERKEKEILRRKDKKKRNEIEREVEKEKREIEKGKIRKDWVLGKLKKINKDIEGDRREKRKIEKDIRWWK